MKKQHSPARFYVTALVMIGLGVVALLGPSVAASIWTDGYGGNGDPVRKGLIAAVKACKLTNEPELLVVVAGFSTAVGLMVGGLVAFFRGLRASRTRRTAKPAVAGFIQTRSIARQW